MSENTSGINFNSKNAASYEELARKAVFGYDQLFKMVLSFLSENQNNYADVLVVGCGTGMELKTFGTLMPNWRITGVDPSEEMIKHSKAKVDEYKLNTRVSLQQGFVDGLPEEDKYDFSTLIFVLRFIRTAEDKKSLFKSIAKRLKPGAKFIIIDQYGDPNSAEFNSLSNSWKNFMKYNGTPSELANKIAEQAVKQSFIDEEELHQLLSETGFERINRFYNSFIHGGWIVEKKY
ncbi:MAG: methyltransferase [Ignavibacteriaceae bacterium]|nr:methyltransferase [Ignavibacteriaceae bacterium]